MLGVDYSSSTYIHLVETIWWNRRLKNDPAEKYIGFNRNKIGAYWDANGKNLRWGKVGLADSRLFSIRSYVDELLRLVQANPQPWK